MNNIYLCSFASNDLNRSKIRFLEQSSSFFKKENLKIYSEQDISLVIKKDINHNLTRENRAFGYGVWKPFIILDYIKKLPEDSILQYADIGCHFNKNGINRFYEYISMVQKYDSLVFEYNGKGFKNYDNLKFQKYDEYQYTKKDLLNYLKVENNKKIVETPQIWSGSFFLKKNKRNINLLKDWLNVMLETELIDGSLSKKIEDKNFIENRWDQSVFSIISKKNDFYKISASECEWAEDGQKRIWHHLNNYPIIAKRDLKRNVFLRFINRQKRTYRRYKNYLIKVLNLNHNN